MDTGTLALNHSSILPCPRKPPPPSTPRCGRATLATYSPGAQASSIFGLFPRAPPPRPDTPGTPPVGPPPPLRPEEPRPTSRPSGEAPPPRPRGLTLPGRRSSSSIAAGWCGAANPTRAPRADKTAPSSPPAASWRWRPSSARRLSAGDEGSWSGHRGNAH